MIWSRWTSDWHPRKFSKRKAHGQAHFRGCGEEISKGECWRKIGRVSFHILRFPKTRIASVRIFAEENPWNAFWPEGQKDENSIWELRWNAKIERKMPFTTQHAWNTNLKWPLPKVSIQRKGRKNEDFECKWPNLRSSGFSSTENGFQKLGGKTDL